jgi:hypothetical protein
MRRNFLKKKISGNLRLIFVLFSFTADGYSLFMIVQFPGIRFNLPEKSLNFVI